MKGLGAALSNEVSPFLSICSNSRICVRSYSFQKRRDSRLAEISEQYPLVRIDKIEFKNYAIVSIAFNCQLHLLLGRKAGSNCEVLLSIC